MLSKRQFLLGLPASLSLSLMAQTAAANPASTTEAMAEINSLLNQYSLTLDTGQIEQCAELFSRAEFEIEGVATVTGKDGVQGLFSGIILYEDGTPRTKHLISNVDIRIADDGLSATASSYLTVMQQAGDAPLRPIFAGAYSDRFALIEGEWVFTSRVISKPLFGDMSLHLTNPPN